MKRSLAALTGLLLLLFLSVSPCLADDPKVVAVEVQGNQDVVSAYILGAAKTRAGELLDREQVQKDIEAIYNLGFFAVADATIEPEGDGVKVVFKVQENPKVKEVRFTGNSVYKEEDLQKLLFTTPGTVFNRVFFRNDLQRVREKYQKDGYVMARVEDVSVENGIVTVKIVEPRIGEIFIQGNKRTKTYVIERELKVKKGDLFNANVLRHSLNRIQGMGFLEDVNVGFEPNEDPNLINLVLTLTEGKSGSISFNLGYGSSSGWQGGLAYQESNLNGRGQKLTVGFDTGDREQYYVSVSDPYMDEHTYAWKFGAYKREWEDINRYYEGERYGKYNQDKQGVYIGAGKKFRHDPRMSWFLNLDWKDVTLYDFRDLEGNPIDPNPSDPDWDAWKNLLDSNGKIFTVTATVTRDNRDPYLSYPKGDIETLNVEKALELFGGERDYTKYWLEGRYYLPINLDKLPLDLPAGDPDNPPLFAARMRVGFSSGEIPYSERYFVGGSTTLRGYEDDEFDGHEMFLTNMELRIPFEKAFSIVVFYDMGMAWNKNDPEMNSFNLGDLKDAYGFGVRVRTPMGNLRLDVATGENETFTHFGFGEMF
ncbi:MAG: BamA/TamA family outer membrane protein [Synergistaceae bacterium]|nr:BamA/TamA family outer membrane protein [Synergistaceae bacterium]